MKFKNFIIPLIIFILGLIIGNFVMLRLILKTNTAMFITSMLEEKDIFNGKNILIFGTDKSNYRSRADSIMVLQINNKKKRINIISIPRDSRIKIPGYGIDKINHAYAYQGEDLLKESVSQLIGLPIHHFIKINIKEVEKIIDTIGGVNITVDKDLNYKDLADDLVIDIKKGKQILNGKQSLHYLRFRMDREGDIGRIKRQQKFIDALNNKLINFSTISKIPTLLNQINKMIESDLSYLQLLNMTNRVYQNKNIYQVKKTIVPGRVLMVNQVSYWKVDMKKLDQEIDRLLFDNLSEKIDLVDNDINRRNPVIKDLKRAEIHFENDEKIMIETIKHLRIEILNGCGIKGLAHKVANNLRKKGLNIVRIENAKNFDYQNSKLVDWKNNTADSLKLANLLQIELGDVIIYDLQEKTLDLTIVIGKNWKKKYE